MHFLDRLNADLKEAMLAGNSMAVSVLRMLKSDLKNAEIAAGAPLGEQEIIAIIRKEAKKRSETAQTFLNAGEPERAAQERAEGLLLSQYLPIAPPTEQVEIFVKDYIQKNLPTPSPKDRGGVIKATMLQFQGSVDGSVVSTIVSRLLP